MAKNNYYVVFSIKKKEKMILEDYDEVLKLKENGGYNCKGFKDKNEAMLFDPFKIQSSGTIKSSKNYYVVFSKKNREKILLTDYNEVLELKEKGGYDCKGFKTKEEALNFDPFKYIITK